MKKMAALLVSVIALVTLNVGFAVPVAAEDNALDGDAGHIHEGLCVESIPPKLVDLPETLVGMSIDEVLALDEFSGFEVAESDESVTRYLYCTDCWNRMYSICLNQRLYSEEESGSHTYPGGTCNGYTFLSIGVDYCYYCLDIKFNYGWHYCLVWHSQCGKGDVDKCPMDYPYIPPHLGVITICHAMII